LWTARISEHIAALTVPAENTNKRHIVPSLLLVLAFALLGLRAESSKTQAHGGDGAGLDQAKQQVLAVRSLETKSSARNVQQPSVPHLVCPATQILVREFRLYFLRTIQTKETAGSILQCGDLRGRAPPREGQV
jgi:hypothetical protein